MSKRKAQVGDTVIVVAGPDNTRPATVLETPDGHRVRVRVIETDNIIWLAADEWA